MSGLFCGKIKKYEQSEFKKLLLFSNMDVSSNRLNIVAKRLEELE